MGKKEAILLLISAQAWASLFEDLATVERVDREIKTNVPIARNYNLTGGYFTMPSARSPKTGTFGMGISIVPSYRNYNISLQLYERIEVTANYHIMVGIPDYVLGEKFGDWADRSLNYKLSLLKPEDSNYRLPGVALGMNDFFGSKNFHDSYAVATQVIPDFGAELSLGYSKGRVQGFFGGLSLAPFYRLAQPILQGLIFSAEYDATDYQNDPTSLLGRDVKFRINAGIHYSLGDVIHFSISSLRGKRVAGAISVSYDLGESPNFFPKFLDPRPYAGPKDHEPIGPTRPYYALVNEVAHAFKEQGLPLYRLSASTSKFQGRPQKHLTLALTNPLFRDVGELRNRIASILASLTPDNVESVTTIIEEEALPAYQMTFRREDLYAWQRGALGDRTMAVLSPKKEIEPVLDERLLFRRRNSRIRFLARPRTRFFFGNSAGKLKYDFSLAGGVQGYLFNQIFYDICASCKLFDGLEEVRDVDKMNPSQLMQVRSDAISYYRGKVGALDRAYIQKSWPVSARLFPGLFARIAGGYFEIAYGGVASEALFQKADANWAIGIEGACVAKRKYSGLSFTRRIRQLEGFTPTYKNNFLGSQYFLSLYLNSPSAGLQGRLLVGQFLGRDTGARLDVDRIFKNGTSVGYWVGFTTAKDYVNGKRFFDQGVSFSVPLDLFSPRSTRQRLGTAASFWLRDTAAVSKTGTTLHQILRGPL